MKIIPSDFFLIRTPSFPIKRLMEFNNNVRTKEDRSIFFKELMADPFFSEALFIASPDLYSSAMLWVENISANTKETEKIITSLYKYFARMCARATPYGLFAGCATGVYGDSTNIELTGNNVSLKKVRLDMNYVGEIVEFLLSFPQVRAHSLFLLNTSLYTVGDKFRYTEYRVINKARMYYLVEITADEILPLLLEYATTGRSIAELEQWLCEHVEISEDDAKEYVEQLISNQLLNSDFELSNTGNDFYTLLIDKISRIDGIDKLASPLITIKDIFDKPEIGLDDYKQIHSILKAVLPHTTAKDLIQVDLYNQPKSYQVDTGFAERISANFEKLYKIKFTVESPDLVQFRNSFFEKYEFREVPFWEALDHEIGIGYGVKSASENIDFTPLVDDISFANIEVDDKVKWSKWRQLQFSKLMEAAGDNYSEIALSDEDLESISDDKLQMPESLFIHGIMSKSKRDNQKDPDFTLIANSGPSGSHLIARFCNGNSSLTEKVRRNCREEESLHKDWIYAEIAHLPQTRVGNVTMRPYLRDYEIVFLTNSNLDKEHQITLDDLTISYHQGEIILKSKRLDKRIIPRLTNAHFFGVGNLSTYKFLGDLQYQGLMPSVLWDWSFFGGMKVYPQVRYKNIILSKKTWVLERKDIVEGDNAKDSAVIQKLKEFCNKYEVPRYASISEASNELLLDFDNDFSFKLLGEHVKKQASLLLVEFNNTPEECIVQSGDGSHIAEFTFPMLTHRGEESPLPHYPRIAQTVEITRNFFPGSEWVYLKLYCGSSVSEKVLADAVKPVVERLLAEGHIDAWFFIRFYDPKSHLRLRFHSKNAAGLLNRVMEYINEPLDAFVKTKLVSKVQVDVYAREIERYSAEAMELSEAFFFHDSVAIVDIISMIEGQEGQELRWLFSLRAVDTLLVAFGYGLAAKSRLLAQLQQSFFEEFYVNAKLRRGLDSKYRKSIKDITAILGNDPIAYSRFEETESIMDIFEIRQSALTAIAKEIHTIAATKSVNYVDQLMMSYIHMTLNRFFISNQRQHETVVYHFLAKYYESMIAQLYQRAAKTQTSV
ncbi:MAG: lantibiotic dehydratase [Bacteroidota bacterium]